ncbi:MAG TPA: ABC transporter ATP-binding protein, partial [Clostridia bacterium]|nr:ABC transporter ATP-binding protein [Clostridia bacterium]
MNNILEVKNLQISFKTFFGEVEAVRDITFSVGRKETVAIVGESGCGKSVTASGIMQLLPMPPAFFKGGEILFNGEDLLKKTEKQMQAIRGNKISMVFQDPMTSLNPTMKIGYQIVEGLVKHHKMSREAAVKKSVEMLELVAVPQPEKRINQYPHEFSGGMRQRVMIALAMVCNPQLLIADEPTTALDVTVQAQILELMKKLQEQMEMSIILITHDLGIVADMSDRVVVMYAGQILEVGLTHEIFASPKHPYTRKLLASVPRLDMSREEPLYSIDGT